MSGHSKWAKTHRQKAVTDAKRGAIFTKLANLITIAVKEGKSGDLESNFKLRLVVDKARAANMPKDNIDRAIKRGTGTGGEGVTLEENIYEVFGPINTTFIVETITDNKNRTIADLKSVLNKNGGQLGGLNTVLWQYNRLGLIFIDQDKLAGKDLDELELALIDAGADDLIKSEDEWEVITAPDRLQEVEKNIKQLKLEIRESAIGYRAKNELRIEKLEDQERIAKLYGVLEDLDDVNNIYTNATW